jgi:hypothetical protein
MILDDINNLIIETDISILGDIDISSLEITPELQQKIEEFTKIIGTDKIKEVLTKFNQEVANQDIPKFIEGITEKQKLQDILTQIKNNPGYDQFIKDNKFNSFMIEYLESKTSSGMVGIKSIIGLTIGVILSGLLYMKMKGKKVKPNRNRTLRRHRH